MERFYIVGGGFLVYPKPDNSKYDYTTGNSLYEGRATAIVVASANNGYKFVNWTKDGAEISTENPYSFTVIEDVELVANFIKDETSIEEPAVIEDVKIYPNPTFGQLRIMNHKLRIDCVECFDVFGKLQRLTTLRSYDIIDISTLPVGIYFLRIQTENGLVTKKIVKQ